MTVTDKMIEELSLIATRNEHGQHFAEWSEHYEALERAGLIRINRPVHEPTGVPYSIEHWTLEVTPAGQAVVDTWG